MRLQNTTGNPDRPARPEPEPLAEDRFRARVVNTRDMSVVADFTTPWLQGTSTRITVTGDARYVVVSDQLGVHVYAADGTRISNFGFDVTAIALHQVNDRLIAVGTGSGDIEVWNIETGDSVVPKWHAHNRPVDHLAYNHDDGSRLLSTSDHDEMRVSDGSGNAVIAVTLDDSVRTASISADGTQVAAGLSGRDDVIVYGVPGGAPVRRLVDADSEPFLVRYAADGSILYSFNDVHAAADCADDEVLIWDAATGLPVGRAFEGHRSPTHQYFYAIGPGESPGTVVSFVTGQLLVWARETAQIISSREFPSSRYMAVDLSPNGRYFVVLDEVSVAVGAQPSAGCGCKSAPSRSPDVIVGSDLAEVTDRVVQRSQDAGIDAPAVVAIGEATFREAFREGIRQDPLPPWFPIPGQSSLVFRICVSRAASGSLVVDVPNGVLRLSIPLMIDINGLPDQSHIPRLARIRVTFQVAVRPRLAVETDQRLELLLHSAEVDGDVDIYVIDAEAVTAAFGPQFTEFVHAQIESIRVAGPEGIATIFPTLLANITVPDIWKQTREYVLAFSKFDYASVEVSSVSHGYLFLVFSLANRVFPPPCRRDGTPLDELTASQSDDDDPSRWCAFALSEKALNVLARPHSVFGDHLGKGQGGNLYWEVETFYEGAVGEIQIQADRLHAKASGTGGGSVRAGLKFPFVKASSALSVTLNDVETSWDVGLRTDPGDKNVTNLYARPTVEIESDDIELTLRSPLPGSLDDATSAILTWFGREFVNLLRGGIVRVTLMEFLHDVLNTEDRDYRLIVVGTRYFDRSSLVVLADLARNDDGRGSLSGRRQNRDHRTGWHPPRRP